MEVIDIVRYAAFKAGIIPSFNPNDLPGDVLDAGTAALSEEILPTLNCDRTLDIAMTSRVYTPENGIIRLMPLTQPIENFQIIGYSSYTADQLLEADGLNLGNLNFDHEVQLLRPAWVTVKPNQPNAGALIASDKWPVNDFNEQCAAAIWSRDMKLVYANDIRGVTPTIMPNVNIDFPPVRIENVIDTQTHIELTYLYRDEYERTFNAPTANGVYTIEEYPDSIVVLFKAIGGPKTLVLPVPLQIINSEHSSAGVIIAPPKFKRYLIDCVAVSLAITYGVSTVDAMRHSQDVSYNLLKKNKPQPMHAANTSELICETLRRPIGRGYGVIGGPV